MERVLQNADRWDRNILPSLMGRYFLTGAERNGVDELERLLDEAVRPKLYYTYDRYASAYPSMPI